MNSSKKRPHHSYETPLPQAARQFLTLIHTIRTPATHRSYLTSVRAFHHYLSKRHLLLDAVQRNDMMQWLHYLKETQNLAAATRVNMLICIRTYLRWLYEQELITTFPDEFIRSTDLPKLPQYLPRPLPPDIDFELQNRFSRSPCIFQKGLLLVRKTGMRIGELINMPYHCTHSDHSGNTFLKVPLGKLNTERLVPLEPKTLQLIKQIQAMLPTPRTFLIETMTGKQAPYYCFRKSMLEATEDLHTPNPITTHQLRHTAATSLRNAGMSLEAIKKFLGHKDFHMTLRYADVTLDSVLNEFNKAIKNVESKYSFTTRQHPAQLFDPLSAVADLIRWANKTIAGADASAQKQTLLLHRRLRRLQNDLKELINSR